MSPDSTNSPGAGEALVVGAGVAGVRAALDLAAEGHRVRLLDASPSMGGLLSRLDHQFPDDHCGMCHLLPVSGPEAAQGCLRRGLFHDRVELQPLTTVAALRGDPGALEVDLVTRARRVDPGACTGCGLCKQACPVEVPDTFNMGLTRRKAIHRPVPHNLPDLYYIDEQACTRCGDCVEVCATNAIDLDASEGRSTVRADAVIFAAGAGLYDPAAEARDLARFLVSPDVLTSLQFERLLSPTGGGGLRRPSDGQPARRIAWLQCVGSRDPRRGRDFCSSVCCTVALKEAVLAKSRGGPGTSCTLFHMDLRTPGKGHYRYRRRAEQEHGVRLRRCRVHEVVPAGGGGLRVRFADTATGEVGFELFDLVVLSTGQAVGTGREALAELLDLSGSADRRGALDRTVAPRPGVFVCGSLLGLTDVAGSVTTASAAAGQASRLLWSLGRRPAAAAPGPARRDATRQRPRVDVVLCRCALGRVPRGVELSRLRETLAAMPDVDRVLELDTPCRHGAPAELGDGEANRLLLGACLPYVHRRELWRAAREAGFDPALTRVMDLYGHPATGAPGERSAESLETELAARASVALAELRAAAPLPTRGVSMEQRALVLGGGVAGLRAAMSLAERGVEVHLVERTGELGGRTARELRSLLDGTAPAALAMDLAQRAVQSHRVVVHLDSQVVESGGAAGRFHSVIRDGQGGEQVVAHGATIIATGSREAQTDQYGFGRSGRVLLQSQLEARLSDGCLRTSDLGQVVMIQCVGSREEGGRQYCSKVCCAGAIKKALLVLEINPEARVLVLNRDITTPGPLERLYTRAREQGVMFVRYREDDRPRVEEHEERLVVSFSDHVLRRQVSVEADLVVLSTGIEPDATAAQVASALNVELDADGFFGEVSPKWRPLDLPREGVFVAGAAHSPQPVAEALVQAEAAAQRAYAFLTRAEAAATRGASTVRHAVCAACRRCVEACPHQARALDPNGRRVEVDPVACRACGICCAACPNGAAELPGLSSRQVMASIEAALADGGREGTP